MHTEFVQNLGSILAIAFIIGVIYIQFTTTNTAQCSDTFIIGYVEKEDPVVVYTSQIDSQLKQDCIDTLIKLGMKKRQANKVADTEFSSINPPKSIQEFLRKVL